MCVFCMIANHEIPAKVIYEDDDFIAFLDLTQTTKGHTLVVPKRHSDNIYSLNEMDTEKAMVVVKTVSLMLKKAFNPIGINIVSNNGKPGQSVNHFHIHLIPRYEDDDFSINYVDHSKTVNLDEIQKEILAANK